MGRASNGLSGWVLLLISALGSAQLNGCGEPSPGDADESGGRHGAEDSGGSAGDFGGGGSSGGQEGAESSGGRAFGGRSAGGRPGVGGGRSTGGSEGVAGERGSGGAGGSGGDPGSGGDVASGGLPGSGGDSGSGPFACPTGVAASESPGGFGGDGPGECLGDREYDPLAEACVVPIACDEGGSPFGGGDGSAIAPFAICSAAQLRAVQEAPGGSHFVLARSLDLSGEGNFSPLGYAGAPFAGSFCGAGRSLLGLVASFPGTDFVGLFASLGSSAVVLNLELFDFEISGAKEVGMLAGRSAGNVSGVMASGVVIGDGTVGGLVGTNLGHITASSSSGQIVAHQDTGYFVGGLVGMNSGPIADSRSSATVEGRSAVGGLVGYNFNLIERSEASGSVRGSHYDIGGLVGGAEWQSVVDSRASGDVEGSGSVGGLVGSSAGWDIIANSEATGDVDSETTAGGLVAYIFRGDVIESRATGNVTAISENGVVGGLVGSGGAQISECVATGTVSGGGTAGGLVGSLGNQMLGGVEHSYALGNVSGGGPVGGLVGDVYWTYDRGAEIGVSYALGVVTGGEPQGGLLGGPVPEDFWVYSSYYLDQSPQVGPGTPLTSAEFADPASFTWTFPGTWVMSEELGHPVLHWEVE